MKTPDEIRREEFAKYLEREFEGDREKFIKASGLSKGRVSQLLDITSVFGERAAKGIEERMGKKTGDIFPSLRMSQQASKNIDGLIPVVGTAKLGDENAYFVELEYPPGIGDAYIERATKDKRAYALKCVGDSMTPRIKHGEYVIISPEHPLSPGDEVLVIDEKDRVMVKVWRHSRDGMAYFESINLAYKPFGIPTTEIKKMQYVVGTSKTAVCSDV